MAVSEGADALITDLGATRYRTAGATAEVGPKIFTAAANTDANGKVTFTLPAGFFTTLHAGFATVGRATTSPTAASFAWIQASSVTSVTCYAAESKSTGIIIGGTAEGLEICGAGVTINLVMFGV